MPNYRRWYIPNGTYFFTVVTQERRPILTTERGRTLLRAAIEREQAKRPFDFFAIVLLPDHLHAIWTLPGEDSDYSTRWSKIKEEFTRNYLASGGEDGTRSISRQRKRQRVVWQLRFWEHHCRDEDDVQRCMDYIHWNPVKHGLVKRVRDYPWSSFHRLVGLGEYDIDWGGGEYTGPEIAGAEWE